MKVLSLLFILFVLSVELYSQDFPAPKLPFGVSLFNQMKVSFDIEKKREIVEDWLNLDYRFDNFSAGIRYETFQPNDPNTAISRGKEKYSDIDFKYFNVNFGNKKANFEITVGNYYALIGRGMILKSYEDRNLRLDNNLLGILITVNYSGFKFTGLSGSAANSNNERKDILYLTDLEYKGLKFIRGGVTFASNKSEVEGLSNTHLGSVRVQTSFAGFEGYFEYGLKKNSDYSSSIFANSENFVGKGIYGSVSYYYDIFSITGEYKLYDNFGFRSYDQTINYNQPPSTRNDYSYQLFNRHPSTLDADNEKGFQLEATADFSEKSSLLMQYSETRTLDKDSYIQRINGQSLDSRLRFREASGEYSSEWSDKFKTIFSLGYNEELDGNTENFTGVIDMRYSLDPTNTIRLILEHQETKNVSNFEQYFADVLSLEYLSSPKYSIAWVMEVKTKEPIPGNRIQLFWNYLQGTLKVGEHTDLSLLVGSREAGIICIGGVCRYEPEFRGIEFKMVNRF
jgi:hypothetical protein